MKHNNAKKRKRRNQSNTSLLEKYEECVNAYKADALTECGKMAKKELVSMTVGKFIAVNIMRIKPVPVMWKRYMDGERVSFNMILDSMGDNGIILGAAAYRIAEQLEIELPENEVQSKEQMVITYVNGQEAPDFPSEDIKISSVYLEYFSQHHNSMFLQNNYLYGLIRDNPSNYEEAQCRIAKSLWEMQIISSVMPVMQYLYACLKRIFIHEFCDEDIDLLYRMKDDYQELVSKHTDTMSENAYKDGMLALASISMALQDIEGFKNAS